MVIDPAVDNAVRPSISHEQLDVVLNAAPKEALILALRALFTAQAWKQSEETLREALLEISHDPESSHEEVYNAVVGGA